MLVTFQRYLQLQTPYRDGDKVLLTVSGGLDSVVMVQLFQRAGIRFGIAHVNFGLRAKESDLDEQLVQELAKQHKVNFYVHRPDTNAYAENQQISIQMAARELRYQWFEQLAQEHSYNWIATAHHQNDVAETLLLNLSHGTGISGLHGILPVKGNIIRPLLFATKEELHLYADSEKLHWREDQSNLTNDYQRNFIRLNVIPLLKEINPSLEHTMSRSAERIRESEILLKEVLRKKAAECEWKDELYYIPESTHQFSTYILHELLQEYGFGYLALQQFIQQAHGAGAQVSSATHTLYTDRGQLIMKEKEKEKESDVFSGPCGTVSLAGRNFELDVLPFNAAGPLSKDPWVAMLDADKLSFPLQFRIWTAGDRLQPLGMKGYKKVSDLLIDQKIPVPEKNKTVVVCSGEEVIWVAGLRIAEPFRISEKTQNILIIRRF